MLDNDAISRFGVSLDWRIGGLRLASRTKTIPAMHRTATINANTAYQPVAVISSESVEHSVA